MSAPTSRSPRAARPTAPASPAQLGVALECGLVAVGGAVGALARAAVAAIAAGSPPGGLLATQAVNGLGAFGLGLLLANLERRGPLPRLRAFLAVGVLGSFTTFSTLVDEGRGLMAGRSPAIALALIAGSVTVGLVAFVLGERLDRHLARSARAQSGTNP